MGRMKYGPKTKSVEAFLCYLMKMIPEDHGNVIGALCAAKPNLWEHDEHYSDAETKAQVSAIMAHKCDYEKMELAGHHADLLTQENLFTCSVARYAAFEIQGADFLRENNTPFFFLPMFGFTNPDSIISEVRAILESRNPSSKKKAKKNFIQWKRPSFKVFSAIGFYLLLMFIFGMSTMSFVLLTVHWLYTHRHSLWLN